jgi:hypothetical protein
MYFLAHCVPCTQISLALVEEVGCLLVLPLECFLGMVGKTPQQQNPWLSLPLLMAPPN